MVSVLACVTWVVCLHEWHSWRAIMSGMLLVLLLLFLKQYHEAKNVEYLLLNKNQKIFQIDLNSDLKEEPYLKSRCWFTLFEPIMPGPSISLNRLRCNQMWAYMPRYV